MKEYRLSGLIELEDGLNHKNESQQKQSVFLPFKYLPFVYFLTAEQCQEIICSIIWIDDYGQLQLDTQNLQVILRGFLPAERRPNFEKFYIKIQKLTSNGKDRYFAKVKMPQLQVETGNQIKQRFLTLREVNDLLYNFTNYKLQANPTSTKQH
eukprot:403336632